MLWKKSSLNYAFKSINKACAAFLRMKSFCKAELSLLKDNWHPTKPSTVPGAMTFCCVSALCRRRNTRCLVLYHCIHGFSKVLSDLKLCSPFTLLFKHVSVPLHLILCHWTHIYPGDLVFVLIWNTMYRVWINLLILDVSFCCCSLLLGKAKGSSQRSSVNTIYSTKSVNPVDFPTHWVRVKKSGPGKEMTSILVPSSARSIVANLKVPMVHERAAVCRHPWF